MNIYMCGCGSIACLLLLGMSEEGVKGAAGPEVGAKRDLGKSLQ